MRLREVDVTFADGETWYGICGDDEVEYWWDRYTSDKSGPAWRVIEVLSIGVPFDEDKSDYRR